MQGYYVTFVGKGWGHGVGLCQWGARGMAEQQFNYKQILAYYYPNTTIAPIATAITVLKRVKPCSCLDKRRFLTLQTP